MRSTHTSRHQLDTRLSQNIAHALLAPITLSILRKSRKNLNLHMLSFYLRSNNDVQSEVSEELNHEDDIHGQKRPIDTLNGQLHNEALNLDDIIFDPPDRDDHLIVGNFDVTDAFYMLQRSVSDHKWKLSLEDHIHLGLAATSILILCCEEHPNDLVPFLDDINLAITRKYIENLYSIRNIPMPMDIVTRILRIVDQG
ncbi:hypothetical protein DFQ28_009119 [Apophysomyces sp. BC1034]|nr:hypothetical protein DFQ30_009948 [Apophysomyces sp. BC1015]KAG0171510.1 hypothetical protein DFQ29_008794 [Apophysomyces sp. BC1021]KAG0185584.1 hypothetical protein DFQ28_009119 [Apophysomyces sp. BC1034]